MISEIDTIREHLMKYPEGLTQTDLSQHLNINRVSLSKYLATMVARGELECRNIGPAKLYTITKRLPLKNILSQTEDHVIITDETGLVTQIDKRTALIFDLHPDLMIGKPLGEGSTCHFFAPDGSPLSARQMSETGSREFMKYSGDHITHFHQKTLSVVLMDGSQGKATILTDITERKRAETEFRQMSADLKLITDNAPAMIWYKDTKNNFIRVNPAGARVLGMAIEEIEGKSAYDLFPDFAEKYYHDDLEVINSGKPKIGIIEPMTIASGEQLWVQTDKIPLRDEQGTITGILVFAVNITERKQGEAALQQVSRKLNLLLDSTMHDILNQLTVLRGELELLERKQPDPSFRANFKKITSAAERIQAIIQFTKTYESVGVNAPVWQDCHVLVNTAAKEALPGQFIVKNDIPAGAELFADLLIARVFYNLMDNAVRYGEKITTIRFCIEKSGDDHLILCEDDGTGIPTDEKEKIFERGFGKNTGLGLFLSREILAITGITITENGTPGKGARFEMIVPKGVYRKSRITVQENNNEREDTGV